MGDKMSPKNVKHLSKIIDSFKDLPSEDKISALDGIIDACEAPELKYLSDRLEIFLKRDFVRFLPTEICIYLLSWLDPVSLGRCCLVSKTWNEAVSACQPAWIHACKTIGWKVDELVTSGSYWKKTYQQALVRLKQLKNGSAFSVTQLLGHTARVYTLCYNGKDVLASGSDDRSVRLWDVATGECLQVIQTHTCADLAFDEFFVYTASFDNTIACWKWDTGDLVRSYRGHTGAVFSISYNDERDLLVSGSADKTVRLWQISTGEEINMYHGHREWVTKVILRKSEVESLHHKPGDFVILSMDKIEIRIWLISQEVNCESLCKLSATDYAESSAINASGIFSYQARLGNDAQLPDNNEHCFLHPQLLFDGSRIMCSSERGILEWDFKDYTLTRVTPLPNDPTYLLGAGKTMLFAADTCENCLFIRVHGAGVETSLFGVSKATKTSSTDAKNAAGHLSPSPETVDYEVERDPNNPCCSHSPALKLPKFSAMLAPHPGDGPSIVTPMDDSVELDQIPQVVNQEDELELVNDINYNSLWLSKLQPPTRASTNGHGDSPDINGDSPTVAKSLEVPGILGKWKLPMCRWSKRGSNYVCGDQSWLNGFSDINHSGLVFAAALPDHSIYLLRWSDCT